MDLDEVRQLATDYVYNPCCGLTQFEIVLNDDLWNFIVDALQRRERSSCSLSKEVTISLIESWIAASLVVGRREPLFVPARQPNIRWAE